MNLNAIRALVGKANKYCEAYLMPVNMLRIYCPARGPAQGNDSVFIGQP
jgi:hypothetical protein